MSSADGSTSPENESNEPSFSIRKSSTDLLRHVLEATLAKGEAGMTHEEWESILEIARTNQGADLPMDRVTELLVDALLATRFPDLAKKEARRQMCQHISSSLCGDPTSMQRLKAFWNQLRESVS